MDPKYQRAAAEKTCQPQLGTVDAWLAAVVKVDHVLMTALALAMVGAWLPIGSGVSEVVRGRTESAFGPAHPGAAPRPQLRSAVLAMSGTAGHIARAVTGTRNVAAALRRNIEQHAGRLAEHQALLRARDADVRLDWIPSDIGAEGQLPPKHPITFTMWEAADLGMAYEGEALRTALARWAQLPLTREPSTEVTELAQPALHIMRANVDLERAALRSLSDEWGPAPLTQDLPSRLALLDNLRDALSEQETRQLSKVGYLELAQRYATDLDDATMFVSHRDGRSLLAVQSRFPAMPLPSSTLRYWPTRAVMDFLEVGATPIEIPLGPKLWDHYSLGPFALASHDIGHTERLAQVIEIIPELRARYHPTMEQAPKLEDYDHILLERWHAYSAVPSDVRSDALKDAMGAALWEYIEPVIWGPLLDELDLQLSKHGWDATRAEHTPPRWLYPSE